MKKIQIRIFIVLSVNAMAQTKQLPQTINNKTAKWFLSYAFDPANFKNPSQSFAPFARWWWPGNNVTQQELKREINLFADNGFGGVEVQPLNLALPMMDTAMRNKVL